MTIRDPAKASDFAEGRGAAGHTWNLTGNSAKQREKIGD